MLHCLAIHKSSNKNSINAQLIRKTCNSLWPWDFFFRSLKGFYASSAHLEAFITILCWKLNEKFHLYWIFFYCDHVLWAWIVRLLYSACKPFSWSDSNVKVYFRIFDIRTCIDLREFGGILGKNVTAFENIMVPRGCSELTSSFFLEFSIFSSVCEMLFQIFSLQIINLPQTLDL